MRQHVQDLVGLNGVRLFEATVGEKPSLSKLFEEDRQTDLTTRAEELGTPIVTFKQLAESVGEKDLIAFGREIRKQLHGKTNSAGHVLTIGGEEFVLMAIVAWGIEPGEIITPQTRIVYQDFEFTTAHHIKLDKAV